MVSEGPPHAAADAALSTRVTVDLEVPDAGRSANCELADTHDERIDPEEHENLVEDNVTCLVTPLHLCDELVARSRFRLANRGYKDRADSPAGKPYESE